MKNKKLILLAGLVTCTALAGCGKKNDKGIEDLSQFNPQEFAKELAPVNNGDAGSSTAAEESQETSEALKAYAEYLSNNALSSDGTPGDYKVGGSDAVFSLEYVNEDDIPDMVIGGTGATHASNIYILSYENGKVNKYGPFGAYNTTSFYPKKGIIATADVGMGHEVMYYSKLNGDGTYTSICHEDYYNDDPDASTGDPGGVYTYYVDEKEVTEEEYEAFKKENGLDDSRVRWSCYENEDGYTPLNAETLSELEG